MSSVTANLDFLKDDQQLQLLHIVDEWMFGKWQTD